MEAAGDVEVAEGVAAAEAAEAAAVEAAAAVPCGSAVASHATRLGLTQQMTPARAAWVDTKIAVRAFHSELPPPLRVNSLGRAYPASERTLSARAAAFPRRQQLPSGSSLDYPKNNCATA